MTYVAATGTARIRHADTGEVFEIHADELDFEAIGADERGMGPEIHHQAELEHPSLGLLSWNLWEYPVGIENMSEAEIGEHKLIDDIDYGLRHEPDFDEPPEEPPTDLTALLDRLPAQLEALDRALARIADLQPRIGHNQPPDEYRFDLTRLELKDVRESVADVRSEVERPDAIDAADAAKLQLAQTRLSSLSWKLGSWTRMLGGAIVVGVAGGIGKGAGEQIWQETQSLHALVSTVQHALTIWIDALMHLL